MGSVAHSYGLCLATDFYKIRVVRKGEFEDLLGISQFSNDHNLNMTVATIVHECRHHRMNEISLFWGFDGRL
jgi:hypothetical protein